MLLASPVGEDEVKVEVEASGVASLAEPRQLSMLSTCPVGVVEVEVKVKVKGS